MLVNKTSHVIGRVDRGGGTGVGGRKRTERGLEAGKEGTVSGGEKG